MGLLEFIDLDTVIAVQSIQPIADLAALGHDLLNAGSPSWRLSCPGPTG